MTNTRFDFLEEFAKVIHGRQDEVEEEQGEFCLRVVELLYCTFYPPVLLNIIMTGEAVYCVSTRSTVGRKENQRVGQCFNTCMCSTSVNTSNSFEASLLFTL